MIHNFRGLWRLQHLQALRQRHIHILTVLISSILLYLTLLSPLQLLIATSSIPTPPASTYSLHLLLSTSCRHALIYSLLLRTYLLWFDAHWARVCVQGLWTQHLLSRHDLKALPRSETSCFIRRRQSLGNAAVLWPYVLCCAAVSVALCLFVEFEFDQNHKHISMSPELLALAAPVALMYVLWLNTRCIKAHEDSFGHKRELTLLMSFVSVIIPIRIASNILIDDEFASLITSTLIDLLAMLGLFAVCSKNEIVVCFAWFAVFRLWCAIRCAV